MHGNIEVDGTDEIAVEPSVRSEEKKQSIRIKEHKAGSGADLDRTDRHRGRESAMSDRHRHPDFVGEARHRRQAPPALTSPASSSRQTTSVLDIAVGGLEDSRQSLETLLDTGQAVRSPRDTVPPARSRKRTATVIRSLASPTACERKARLARDLRYEVRCGACPGSGPNRGAPRRQAPRGKRHRHRVGRPVARTRGEAVA
jgi:hypothetical protein